MKKFLTILGLLSILAIDVFAATGTLTTAATEMQTEVAGWLKALKWLAAIAGPAVAVAAGIWQWNKIADAEAAKSDGQGQGPAGGFMKLFKIVGMAFAGFAVMFIFYGILAVVLLGKSFSSGWGIMVNDFWNAVLL